MKVEKKVLTDALRVLGKVVCQTSPVEVFRCVRFVSQDDDIWAEATDGMEKVSLRILRGVQDKVDFVVEYRALRELVRTAKGNVVELEGKTIEYPQALVVPADAEVTELPENFCDLLALAAPVVNRTESRMVLRGINLSADGVTVTDGKQLLNLPCPLTLRDSVTIPFPFALLAAKLREVGKLASWTSKANRLFRMEIGDFVWYASVRRELIRSGNE